MCGGTCAQVVDATLSMEMIEVQSEPIVVFLTRSLPKIHNANIVVGGILPWAFSPLLFYNEMSLLLNFPDGH